MSSSRRLAFDEAAPVTIPGVMMPSAPVMPVLPVLDAEIVADDVTPVDLDQIHQLPVLDADLVAQYPHPGLLRRLVDDPYWVLLTLSIGLPVAIGGTLLYGIVEVVLSVARWFTTNGTTLAVVAVAVVALALLSGGTAAKCAGIHCDGCRG